MEPHVFSYFSLMTPEDREKGVGFYVFFDAEGYVALRLVPCRNSLCDFVQASLNRFHRECSILGFITNDYYLFDDAKSKYALKRLRCSETNAARGGCLHHV